MTQLNDSDIFTRTLFLPPGRVIGHKFFNGDITGNQWDGNEELEGMECVDE
ncbi:hypothetical protein [Natronoflexus pectinivorans]|uniref:Uncharacterized protein n=1 Tax=Natronoflexus pectinivorans TaxID=682526 RepID=A0A4R2GLB9_9BACT|nr:hypothetical protein [Natronoflexus pectinivorans]TCO09713.1 hypothetical protein EV194_102139 [Natronoflexus pectinivorans]